MSAQRLPYPLFVATTRHKCPILSGSIWISDSTLAVSAQPGEKTYRLFDGSGLYLELTSVT